MRPCVQRRYGGPCRRGHSNSSKPCGLISQVMVPIPNSVVCVDGRRGTMLKPHAPWLCQPTRQDNARQLRRSLRRGGGNGGTPKRVQRATANATTRLNRVYGQRGSLLLADAL